MVMLGLLLYSNDTLVSLMVWASICTTSGVGEEEGEEVLVLVQVI